MKLELKVTKRDKVLLIIMLVVGLIAAYIYFGIIMTADRIDQLTIEQENLEIQKQNMDMKIAQIPVYEISVERASEEYEALTKGLFPVMTNEEVGAYITDLMVEEGMKIQDLDIQEAGLREIAPYSYSEKAKAAASGEDGTEVSGKRQSEDSLPEDGAQSEETEVRTDTELVYSCEVTCRATGTKQHVRRLLDTLAGEDGIRVASFSVSDVTKQVMSGESVRYTTKKELIINLVIYMCRK